MLAFAEASELIGEQLCLTAAVAKNEIGLAPKSASNIRSDRAETRRSGRVCLVALAALACSRRLDIRFDSDTQFLALAAVFENAHRAWRINAQKRLSGRKIANRRRQAKAAWRYTSSNIQPRQQAAEVNSANVIEESMQLVDHYELKMRVDSL